MKGISRRNSQTTLRFACLFALAASIGGTLTGCGGESHPASQSQKTTKPPFSLAIVSGRRDGITMSKKGGREFYVVLTNTSQNPEPVWEYWNSWGYQAISFELEATDGKKFVITAKDRAFDYNFPSTFKVDPGEHQVFPIRFDDSWEVEPALPIAEEMPIALRAIYSVSATPDFAKYHVWSGRVDSHSYNFTLSQY